MPAAVAEQVYVNSCEASHVMLHPDLREKKWFIRDEKMEEILKDLTINWTVTIVQNSWEKYARMVSWSVDTGKGAIHSSLQVMVKNCGAAVFHGIDNLNDYTFPISEFIAKNVASYTGTGTLIATGTAESGKRLEACGWIVPIYAESSRWNKNMAYGMTNIPRAQMHKYGYNSSYHTHDIPEK